MRNVMQARLREITARAPETFNAGGQGSLDPAAQEKLQALGYVGFKAPVQGANLDKLADPKDKVGEFEAILSAADAFRAGAFDKGRELLAPVQKSDPQMYLVPFMLAEAALRQREWQGATANFRRALELNPAFDQAMTGIARSLFEQGNSEEATAWLDKALKQNDKNVRAWYQLGWMQAQTAPDEAAQSFEKCLELQPNFAPARRDLGMLYIRGQQYVEAAKELRAAADLGLNEAKLFNFLGIAYSRTNRLKEAVASYRRALKLDPHLAETHLNLGFVYQRLKQVDQARNEYSEACRLESKLCSMVPQ
jgi:superkiller protein 3